VVLLLINHVVKAGRAAVRKNIFWNSPPEETEPPKEARGSIGGFSRVFPHGSPPRLYKRIFFLRYYKFIVFSLLLSL
jgi:hypothetical protein